MVSARGVSAVYELFRWIPGSSLLKRSQPSCFSANRFKRNFGDKSNVDSTSTQIVVRDGGTSERVRVRVRRARAADTVRVLRFVRQNAHAAWPGLAPTCASTHLVLADYIARALAQGHSLVAEQQQRRGGWCGVRGVAVGAALSPWDAALVTRWSRCVRAQPARRALSLAAHSLRHPDLHHKYQVHKILQVVLIVPPDARGGELAQTLARHAIQRGRDVGFPLLRFDVTTRLVAKSLENLKLNKEWEQSYELLPLQEADAVETAVAGLQPPPDDAHPDTNPDNPDNPHTQPTTSKSHFIAVYTALTHQVK